MALHSMIPPISTMLRSIHYTSRFYQWQIYNLNPETVQIILAGLSGMFLLPTCYTTGLILTSPTVASVWDGPIIPLGCFCAAVSLGFEKRSVLYPSGQVGSLLLTVGGSIIVLLVDYLGGGHGIKRSDDSEKDTGLNNHMQFIQGNMVLMGVVASYSATALLQKRLTHYPPIQLTGWMFASGHVGCLSLLLLDSMMGGRITGYTLRDAIYQIHHALTTSPTFLYGVLYSAIFVSGACFTISSYASSHLESSVITLFAALQPPITAVLEWIWEGKGLGLEKIGGMICVGIGMWLFTSIKKMENERTVHGSHTRSQIRARSKKAESYENGDLSSNSIPIGGSNPMSRKTHADV